MTGTRLEIHTSIHFCGGSSKNTYSCYDEEDNVYDIIPESNEFIFIGKTSSVNMSFSSSREYDIGLKIYPYRFIKIKRWNELEFNAVVKNILDCIKKTPDIFLDEFSGQARKPNKNRKYPHIKYTDLYMCGKHESES